MRWIRRKLPLTTITVIIMVAGHTALGAESSPTSGFYVPLHQHCHERETLLVSLRQGSLHIVLLSDWCILYEGQHVAWDNTQVVRLGVLVHRDHQCAMHLVIN